MIIERIHKRGEANAFFVFLIKTKLAYKTTGKITYSISRDELFGLIALIKEKISIEPGIDSLLKKFAKTHSQRSCVISKKLINRFCYTLLGNNYDEFKNNYKIDYTRFVDLYNNKFKPQIFNEQLAFNNFTNEQQAFILKKIERLVLRDAEIEIKKNSFEILCNWLNKKCGITKKQHDNEMRKYLLNKRLEYYASLKNYLMPVFLQQLSDNIAAGNELFFHTGLSMSFVMDLIQIWKKGEPQNISRLEYYKKHLTGLGSHGNNDILQPYWFGAFSTVQIINNNNINKIELENMVSENLKTMDKHYDKMIEDGLNG